MRCSICDSMESSWIYRNWHCSTCSNIIRQSIGDLHEKDIEEIFDEDQNFLQEVREYSFEDSSDLS